MNLRVYIDTSVLGGCEDLEFQEFSRQLMEHFVEGHFILVLSDLTVQELAAAPAQVRARLMEVPEEHIEALQLDSEAMDLAGSARSCEPMRSILRLPPSPAWMCS